jgi:heme-degrading monooxygenase HmoA
MHARVVTAQMNPGTIGEATRIYRDSVAPAAAQQRGNKGVILLVEPKSSKAISITIWDTPDNMTTGELSGYLLEQFQKFAGILGDAPLSQHFEVAFSSVAT